MSTRGRFGHWLAYRSCRTKWRFFRPWRCPLVFRQSGAGLSTGSPKPWRVSACAAQMATSPRSGFGRRPRHLGAAAHKLGQRRPNVPGQRPVPSQGFSQRRLGPVWGLCAYATKTRRKRSLGCAHRGCHPAQSANRARSPAGRQTQPSGR